MSIEKIGCVVGWFEVHCRRVALRTAEWRINLGVANKAICHVGEIRFRQCSSCKLEATMTCLTRILGDQVRTEFQYIEFVWRAQVLIAIDCAGNDRGNVSEAQV